MLYVCYVCMCVRMYVRLCSVHMYVWYVRTYVRVYKCDVYMYVMYVCMMCKSVRILCMYVCIDVRVHVMYVGMYVCNVCMYVCMLGFMYECTVMYV